MCLGFCSIIGQVCAFGVRAARCRFFLVSSLLETKFYCFILRRNTAMARTVSTTV